MRAYSVVMDGTDQTLRSALALEVQYCDSILLQNPTGNADVLVGGPGSMPFVLVAAATVALPVNDLSQVGFKGTNLESLVALVFP